MAQTELLLTYTIPLEFQDIVTGKLCIVPVRQGRKIKKCCAVFLDFCNPPDFLCQDIHGFAESGLQFHPLALSFVSWVADYYLCRFEKAIRALAPGFVWDVKKQELLSKRKMEIESSDEARECVWKNNHQLNESQKQAYDLILKNDQKPTLLFGVTGCGKTEIYLELSKHILSQGKSVLILVPEIVLTPQMAMRFRNVFGNQVAVLHSGLSPKEHMKQWMKTYLGRCSIVLGVRTSVFCPLKNMGLIIVDEEHDSSYKAMEAPPYHARDLAVVRAKMEKAYCVLGTATPSLETVSAVQFGKYACAEIQSKFSTAATEYAVVDARQEFSMPKHMKKNPFLKLSRIDFSDQNFQISENILSLLHQVKQRKEQSMILLNRRGYVNYAVCQSCKNPLSCPSCSVTTSLHQKAAIEICHYCGFQCNRRTACLHCGSTSFSFRGIGTQHLQDQLQKQLPHFHIARLDRDTLTSHKRLSEIIEDMQKGHIDCLVGTQLLSKGHDFANVTLIVILHIEDALFLPDFRSGERTFQLLLQSMGRVARGSHPGQVVLQTFLQEHPVVQFALNQDVHGFLERELKRRELAWNPPFSRQILLEIRHKIKEKALCLAGDLAKQLSCFWQQQQFSNQQIRLAGPVPAAIERVSEEYRMQICIHFSKQYHPQKVVPKQILEQKQFAHCLRVDVDPFSFI